MLLVNICIDVETAWQMRRVELTYIYWGILLVIVAASAGLYRDNNGPLIQTFAVRKASQMQPEVVDAFGALEKIIDRTRILKKQHAALNLSAYRNVGLKLELLPSNYFDSSEKDWIYALGILRQSFPEPIDHVSFALLDCYRRFRQEVSREQSDRSFTAVSSASVYQQRFQNRMRYFGADWTRLLFEFEHELAMQGSAEIGAWLAYQISNAKPPLCQLNDVKD